MFCSLYLAAVPTMKAFRTATTLCIADPTFHDVTRHRILLPQGTPVQRELLTGKLKKKNYDWFCIGTRLYL
jgi:hypothetical protein